MEHDADSTGDFQRSTRMPLDAVVRLHFEGTVAYQNGFAANVSATGMFVKHPAPPPVGTRLVFEFSLGAERAPVQGSGEVVWVRDRYLGPGQPAGVGIRFHQLDSQSRDHIAEALFEYLERSLAEEPAIDPERLAGQIGAVPEAIASLADAMPIAATAPPPRIDLASLPPIARPGSNRAGLPGAEDLGSASAPTPESAATPPAEPVFGGRVTPAPGSFAVRTPPAEPAERQPFAVFSSLDSADASTAAIVREALRDVPPPSLSLAGAAVSASAASDRRSRSPWAAIALGLVLAGAAGWFAWQRWGAPAAPPAAVAPSAVEPEPPKPEPLSAAPDPSTTLAEAVGVDPNVRSPAAEPPISRAPTGAPQEEAAVESEPAGESADAAAEESPAAGTESAATAVPVTIPEAAAPTSTAPAPAATAATSAAKLVAIAWRSSTGTADLVISGDAPFAAGSYSYSEIGGENPRVLIKLRGMESPFRGAVSGATALARGVRSGFHLGTRGNEIHIVVDLALPAAKVAALAPDGGSLVLSLVPR